MFYTDIYRMEYFMTRDRFAPCSILIIIDNIECIIECGEHNHKYFISMETFYSGIPIITLKNRFNSPHDILSLLFRLVHYKLFSYNIKHDTHGLDTKMIALSYHEYDKRMIYKKWMKNPDVSYKFLKRMIKQEKDTCYVCLENQYPFKTYCNHSICIYCFEKCMIYNDNMGFRCGICRQNYLFVHE